MLVIIKCSQNINNMNFTNIFEFLRTRFVFFFRFGCQTIKFFFFYLKIHFGMVEKVHTVTHINKHD